MAPLSASLVGAGILGLAAAQYFPPPRDGVTTLPSKFHSGVSIDYKEPGICETTAGVRSYSGYVNMPPNSLDEVGVSQPYNMSYFFWYFESRKDAANAPLSIWMNGGPGSSSLVGLLTENGPCTVNADSNGTRLNRWSWNNEVNMLYIDQPTQVGFSYDTLANGTIDLFSGDITPADFSRRVPAPNDTTFVGTFSSQTAKHSANSTANGARALWYFAQTWFAEFPAYRPNNSKIGIWTESVRVPEMRAMWKLADVSQYGGRYGPAYTAFFERQNRKIENGSLAASGAIPLHVDTLGIVNGCIDLLAQEPAYPAFAHNNTYGIQVIDRDAYEQALDAHSRPGGCRDQIIRCRELAARLDRHDHGNSAEVNAACSQAARCAIEVEGVYFDLGDNGYYDVAHQKRDPFPHRYFAGFLNQHWVQAALGVPLNHTILSKPAGAGFEATGDCARGDMLEELAYVLDSGIKVALMYGDRDYSCNWIGGEAASVAVGHAAADGFRAAGYADLMVNDTHRGGAVRQHGNLSFSRVFQAGHQVPAYQPEAAYEIFMRATFDRDIATGALDTAVRPEYSTRGPASSFGIKQAAPRAPAPECYQLTQNVCTEEHLEAIRAGNATFKHFVFVGATDEYTST
ncbi:MAG: hypothetical protein M1832_001410 [Thelocarpon impressellum]|nr:MAG: hypothetical protein M1832_001410 [Thelocarpon impressellum]